MKQYSNIRSVQLLASILQNLDITHFIISPGSRNAPLAIHFSTVDTLNCFSIVDERSAAFVALGMAKKLQKPVAIICTSGSAVANYYPAVTEAFYSNVPILILTADRPTDFVDLFDGQTIRQKNIFQNHSYGDFELLDDGEMEADEINAKEIIKAVHLCYEKNGPVHINIPLKEPLYKLVSELPVLSLVENKIQIRNYQLSPTLIAEWNLSTRIMILVGTQPVSPELNLLLGQLVKNHSVVVLTEVNSNVNHEKFFQHIDRYIFNFTEVDTKKYAPELLITIGQNVVSKKVKQFLRDAKPKNHWHVDPYWHPDTYFSLTEKISASAEDFLKQLLQKIKLEPQPYYNLWDSLRVNLDLKHAQYIQRLGFCDMQLYLELAQIVPKNYVIHFGNSSPIRYAQLFDFNKNEVHCNRGTSGIDGSTSTAMGFAMVSKEPILLVTGDLSFMYDINGLWNQYIPPYTRIIILNNGGGDIFKIIPGPTDATFALDEFITTSHQKNVEHLALHFDLGYIKVEDESALTRVLGNFFKPSPKPIMLEINTKSIENASVLKNYFQYLKNLDI